MAMEDEIKKIKRCGVAPIRPDMLRVVKTTDELAGRFQAQGFVRMDLVVILEPVGQLRQNDLWIRSIMDIDVIAFEALHERLGHAIGLRASYRREARHQAQANGKLDRLVRS